MKARTEILKHWTKNLLDACYRNYTIYGIHQILHGLRQELSTSAGAVSARSRLLSAMSAKRR